MIFIEKLLGQRAPTTTKAHNSCCVLFCFYARIFEGLISLSSCTIIRFELNQINIEFHCIQKAEQRAHRHVEFPAFKLRNLFLCH